MAFKMAPPDFNNKDQSLPNEGTIIREELEEGVVAEAHKDGTIKIDKDVDPNSKKAKHAIDHELAHLEQFRNGDLDYNEHYVFWKGKKYPRKNMDEGAHHLPWEKDAENKTKHA
jgi:hypothetical protein